jgi:MFS-type transporter involved in bile tolerance (Atg22 family)
VRRQSPSPKALPLGVIGPLATPMLLNYVDRGSFSRWMGLQNMVGNLSGILAPVMTGYMVQTTGSFAGAFTVSAIVALIGIASYTLIAPAIMPVDPANARQ